LLNMDFFSKMAPLASSNTGFFLQTLTTSPNIDFFSMADHAVANAYSNAMLDNFLD
jgi:hypothetical protein